MLFSHSSEQSDDDNGRKNFRKHSLESQSESDEKLALTKFIENDEENTNIKLKTSNQHSCAYCLNNEVKYIAQCFDCKQYFCNSVISDLGSHLVVHLVRSKHKQIQLHKESVLGDIILECFFCSKRNIFALGFAPYRANQNNELIICCRKFNCATSETISTHDLNPNEWEPLIKEKRLIEFILPTQPISETKGFLNPTVKAIYEFEQAHESGNKVSMYDIISKKVSNFKLPKVQLQWANIKQYCHTFKSLIEMEIHEDEKIYDTLFFEKVNIRWEIFDSKRKKGSFVLPLSEEININSLKGQEVLLLDTKSKEEVGFMTIVNIIGMDQIVANLKKEIRPIIKGIEYDVRMIFKPTSFIRMLDGLDDLLQKAPKVIDPKIFQILLGNVYSLKNTEKQNTRFHPSFLKNVPGIPSLNQSQLLAVEKAVTNNFSLLQGPPGTGKSVTCSAIVYYFTKLFEKNPPGKNEKILVCAPSNIAVDHLTSYISKIGVNVVQVCSRMRENVENLEGPEYLHNKFNEELKKPENDFFRALQEKKKAEFITEEENKQLHSREYQISLNILKKADVICCTCISSYDPRLAKFQFPIVLIDEATQAIEPEELLPLLKKADTVILIGDHMQLGPVVMSNEAGKAGLKQSLFERMIKMGMTPIRLQMQYRMHPELSIFSSETFYEGGLQNGVNSFQRTDKTLNFNWPNPSKPLFFWHLIGKEELSGSGTSYLNKMEAEVIDKIVTTFYNCGLEKNKLCVITPYKGQKAYLRNLISQQITSDSQFFESIEINSIDSFQGREKDYVILSTVRSSDSSGIGFLKDERRLNVALTRAKFGLIIVGNAHSLSKSLFWKSLLYYFSNNKLIFEGSTLENLRPSLMTFEKPESLMALDKAKVMKELNLEELNSSKLRNYLADDFRKSELGFTKLPQN